MKLFGYAGALATDRNVLSDYARSRQMAGRAPALGSAEPSESRRLSGEFTAENSGVWVGIEGGPAVGSVTRAGPNPAAAVLQTYLKSGIGCLEQVHGSFALAIIDQRDDSVLLALDRLGIERLSYAQRGAAIVFSTSASAVAQCPGIRAELSAQSLYDYLLLHMIPAPTTAYANVQKLRPGTAALFKGGKLSVLRYWRPLFNEERSTAFADVKSQLQESLRAAVESCSPDYKTGAFLSGGLDSSSVAGMLAKVQGSSAQTFSMGFGVDSYDELAYARIANRHFGTAGHEYHVTPEDILTAFPKIASAYDEPFGNSSAVPTYVCAKFAVEHGVDHLLAGDGGDEIFGGNDRYVRQSVFETYFSIPSWVRTGLIEPLLRRVSPDSAITPLRKARSYLDQASVRLPERLETWNHIYREGAAKVLDPEFLRSVDPRAPLAAMKEVFYELPDISLLNRMLFYDWQYTLSDNDLRKVKTMCELAGVRVSYPMLDERVVDVSLRVPSAMKIEGTELRSFYKRAMADFLPPEILTKHKHGFGLPFGVWLKTHGPLRELIFAHLESLRARHIVRAEFIDEIVAKHGNGAERDASFYGYPMWDMAMLDAWMTSHGLRT